MGWRQQLLVGMVAVATTILPATGALAQVGDPVDSFDKGPMVASGKVAFLEPFSLKNHTLNGMTYSATAAYQKACQIMLIVSHERITSEIFAIPVVGDKAMLKAERVLLDSFLQQSGIPAKFHPMVRQHMVDAMDKDLPPKQIGDHAVQAMLIPAEVPLLVVAVARDMASLPLPKPRLEGQVEQ